MTGKKREHFFKKRYIAAKNLAAKEGGEAAGQTGARRRRGFTMTELLAVVAILVVLLAIGVPAAFLMVRNARVANMDRLAETIYIAANRRLTSLAAAGRIGELSNALERAGLSPASHVDSANRNAASELLLGDGVISGELYEGNWYVTLELGVDESHAEYGTVTEVFFAEKGDQAVFAAQVVNDAASRAAVAAKSPRDRARDGAIQGRIGYYNGQGWESPTRETLPDVLAAPLVGVRLINQEELIAIPYVIVPKNTADNEDGYYFQDVLRGLKLTLTVSQSGGEKQYTFSASGTDTVLHCEEEIEGVLDPNGAHFEKVSKALPMTFETLGVSSNTYERVYAAAIVLDSLEDTDQRPAFRSLRPTSGSFAPGEDLTFEVQAEVMRGKTINPPGPEDETEKDVRLNTAMHDSEANSLFAKKSDNAAGNFVYIEYGRHLQNLDTATSQFMKSGSAEIYAFQTEDIAFADADTDPEHYFAYWKNVYGDRAFTPIVNRSLDLYSANLLDPDDPGQAQELSEKDLTEEERNRNRKRICDLKVTGANTLSDTDSADRNAAGLFGVWYGKMIQDVALCDPILNCPDADYAGALAGRATEDLSIAGSAVYLSGDFLKAAADASADTVSWLTGKTCAGGLVGIAEKDLTVSESFAATVISAASADYDRSTNAGAWEAETLAGGLAGQVDGTLTVKESYADCYLGAETVGGLAAACGTDSAFDSSYSAGFVLGAPKKAAGFAPCEIARAVHSYSAFSFVDITTSNAGDFRADTRGLSPLPPIVEGKADFNSVYGIAEKITGDKDNSAWYLNNAKDPDEDAEHPTKGTVARLRDENGNVVVDRLAELLADEDHLDLTNPSDDEAFGTGDQKTRVYHLDKQGFLRQVSEYPFPVLQNVVKIYGESGEVWNTGGAQDVFLHHGDWVVCAPASFSYWLEERNGETLSTRLTIEVPEKSGVLFPVTFTFHVQEEKADGQGDPDKARALTLSFQQDKNVSENNGKLTKPKIYTGDLKTQDPVPVGSNTFNTEGRQLYSVDVRNSDETATVERWYITQLEAQSSYDDESDDTVWFYSYDLLLDSLEDGRQFKNLFGSSNPPQGVVIDANEAYLTPGVNVIVSPSDVAGVVDLNGNQAIADEVEGKVELHINSLFETRGKRTETEVNGKTVISVTNLEKATVAYGRHLQNLDTEISGLPNDNPVTEVTQTRNIYFCGTDGQGNYVDEDGNEIYTVPLNNPPDPDLARKNAEGRYMCWSAEYADETVNAFRPFRRFTPIRNDQLESYNGDGYAIRDLTVYETQNGSPVGLFSVFGGHSLQHLTLIDPIINPYEDESGTLVRASVDAGALAGRLEALNRGSGPSYSETVINDCGVYMTVKYTDPPEDALGNLPDYKTKAEAMKEIGKAPDWLVGGDYAGGLVGLAVTPLDIRNSYAATVVKALGAGSSTPAAGGLVGGTDPNTPYRGPQLHLEISRSYADCYLYGGRLGGLVGSTGSTDDAASPWAVAVQESYAAGFLVTPQEGREQGASTAGMVNGYPVTLGNCYTACTVAGNAAARYNLAPDPESSGNNVNPYSYYVFRYGDDYTQADGESSHYFPLDWEELNTGKHDAPFVFEDREEYNAPYTVPYSLFGKELDGKGYIYPRITRDDNGVSRKTEEADQNFWTQRHFGDWVKDFRADGLVYFEQYYQGEALKTAYRGPRAEPDVEEDAACVLPVDTNYDVRTIVTPGEAGNTYSVPLDDAVGDGYGILMLAPDDLPEEDFRLEIWIW